MKTLSRLLPAFVAIGALVATWLVVFPSNAPRGATLHGVPSRGPANGIPAAPAPGAGVHSPHGDANTEGGFGLDRAYPFRSVEDSDMSGLSGEVTGAVNGLFTAFRVRAIGSLKAIPEHTPFSLVDRRLQTVASPRYDNKEGLFDLERVEAVLMPGAWVLWCETSGVVLERFFWSSGDSPTTHAVSGITARGNDHLAGMFRKHANRAALMEANTPYHSFHWTSPGEIGYVRSLYVIGFMDVLTGIEHAFGPLPRPMGRAASNPISVPIRERHSRTKFSWKKEILLDERNDLYDGAMSDPNLFQYNRIYAVRANTAFAFAVTNREVLVIGRRGNLAAIVKVIPFRNFSSEAALERFDYVKHDFNDVPAEGVDNWDWYDSYYDGRCNSPRGTYFVVPARPDLFALAFTRGAERDKWLLVAVNTETQDVFMHTVDLSSFGDRLDRAKLKFVDFNRKLAYLTCAETPMEKEKKYPGAGPWVEEEDRVIIAVSLDEKPSVPVAVYRLPEPGSNVLSIIAGPEGDDVLALIRTDMGRRVDRHMIPWPQDAPQGWYSKVVKLTPP